MNTYSLQQPSERYHAAYDNTIYTDIRRKMIADMFGEDVEFALHEENTNVVNFMNTLIDACLECCGSTQHSGAHVRLAVQAAWSKLSDGTIDAVYHYLLTFQRVGTTAAEDFEGITKALRHNYAGQHEIGIATAHANGVHGWQGRMAYDLLAAADYLSKAAELLLQNHEEQAYIREKLKLGMNRITGALYEGIHHSDRPAMFNFKGTCFPTERDRS